MNIQKAIENITYFTNKFPAEEFKYISGHPKEAIPYFYSSIDHVIENNGNIKDNYELYFYALFFLAEFQDRESFTRIIELSSLPSETVNNLLEDVIADNLANILYNTYDGQINLLKNAIMNPDIDEFVRNAMLNVMGQLYLDGSLDKTEFQDFLKKLICQDDMGESSYTFSAATICNCHLIELLPDIRRLFDEDLIDVWIYGEYDSFVDMMFEYSDYNSRFCNSSVEAEQLKYWAMFEQDEENIVYTVETIETEEERQKYLKDYPETPTDKKDGHIYIDDYFDDDSINIDRLIYLAVKQRPIPMSENTPEHFEAEINRKKIYFLEAFSKFKEKYQKENVKSIKEYDEKHSIHYLCNEWLTAYMTILDECGENEKCKEIMDYLK